MDWNVSSYAYINTTMNEGGTNTPPYFFTAVSSFRPEITLPVSLGLLANVTVCVVITRSGRLFKNVSNTLIFHLSVTDIIFRIIMSAIIKIFVDKPRDIGEVTQEAMRCKLIYFFANLFVTATFCTLAAIALDRHKNVFHPLENRVRNHNYKLPLLVIWLYAGFSSMWILLVAEGKVFSACRNYLNTSANATKVCRSVFTRCYFPTNIRTQIGVTGNFVASFAVPLLVVIVSYSKITFYLWKRSKNGTIHGAVAKSKVKSVRMLVLVVLGFVLTWGPKFVFSLAYSFYPKIRKQNNVLFAMRKIEIISLFSSVINPLIYAFYSPEFRRDCMTFCCCCGRFFKLLHCACPDSLGRRISPPNESRDRRIEMKHLSVSHRKNLVKESVIIKPVEMTYHSDLAIIGTG